MDTKYKLVGFMHAGGTCEHCGHDITNIFIVRAQDGNGTTLRVGSECVKHFVDANEQVTQCTKRAARAARQWRDFRSGKNAPPAREGETREQYINRRVNEMARAFNAAKQVQAIMARRSRIYRRGQPDVIAAHRFMHRAGFEYPGFGQPGCDAWMQMAAALAHEFRRRWEERTAARLGANAFDIFRPLYEVRKI